MLRKWNGLNFVEMYYLIIFIIMKIFYTKRIIFGYESNVAKQDFNFMKIMFYFID